jgi:DNA-binding transcriptional regulator of glucitol operon
MSGKSRSHAELRLKNISDPLRVPERLPVSQPSQNATSERIQISVLQTRLQSVEPQQTIDDGIDKELCDSLPSEDASHNSVEAKTGRLPRTCISCTKFIPFLAGIVVAAIAVGSFWVIRGLLDHFEVPEPRPLPTCTPASPPLQTIAPTVAPVVVHASSSAAVLLTGFDNSTDFTHDHALSFMEAVEASSAILTSPSDISNVVATNIDFRRHLMSSISRIQVSFQMRVNLMQQGYIGSGELAASFAYEALSAVVEDLRTAFNTSLSNSNSTSFLASLKSSMTKRSMNASGIGVDVQSTTQLLSGLISNIVITEVPATKVPSPLPSVRLAYSKPMHSPTLSPSSIPMAEHFEPWVPMDDPFLISWWPLDSDFNDFSPGASWGKNNLTSVLLSSYSSFKNVSNPDGSAYNLGFFEKSGYPSVGGSYGPTVHITDSSAASYSELTGAVSSAMTEMPPGTNVTANGMTLSGWCLGENGGSGGELFGFGTGAWGTPSLLVSNSWGFVMLIAGSTSDSLAVRYSRSLWDGCWHHIALVILPGWERVELYVDSIKVTSSEFTILRLPADGNYSLGQSPSLRTPRGINGHAIIGSSSSASAFRIGTNNDGVMRVDEVNLWSRALNSQEIRAVSSFGTTNESYCPSDDTDDSGASESDGSNSRCSLIQEHDEPSIELSVRFLTASIMVVVSDPTSYLHSQVHARCGISLAETEKSYRGTDPTNWHLNYEYKYAALEVIDLLRPGILESLSRPGHFNLSISVSGEECELVATDSFLWPNAAREMRIARALGGGSFDMANGGHEMVASAEVQYFTFFNLVRSLQAREPRSSDMDVCALQVEPVNVTVRDSFGNNKSAFFDDCRTVSFAIKIDQYGYLESAPKFGYLGVWLGGAGGAMNVSEFNMKMFYVREYAGTVASAIVANSTAGGSASVGRQVFEGTMHSHANDTIFDGAPLLGENILELNFSAFEPSRDNGDRHYRLQVPGVGVSWPFDISQDALGNAFYLHARGMYHQRCGTNLTSNFTGWARGDVHRTFRGGHPPEDEDYKNHVDEGWGFRREIANGTFEFVDISWFDVVTWRARALGRAAGINATEEPWSNSLPAVSGGWHDAGDFDRRDFHFNAVADLVKAYLMAPSNFNDGQLHLPESLNDIPDILDEAIWGVEVWRQAQLADSHTDGRVSTWIEASSHPKVRNAATDSQPYYLGLATRQSSLHYAAHAALVARALLTHARQPDTPPSTSASCEVQASTFIDSARLAFAFGTRTDIRVSFSLFDQHLSASEVGAEAYENVTWAEPPEPGSRYVLYAAAELWLATGDDIYMAVLNTSAQDAALRSDVTNVFWQPQQATDLLTFCLNITLPNGTSVAPQWPYSDWLVTAKAALVGEADAWLSFSTVNAYRRVWYPPSQGLGAPMDSDHCAGW